VGGRRKCGVWGVFAAFFFFSSFFFFLQGPCQRLVVWHFEPDDKGGKEAQGSDSGNVALRTTLAAAVARATHPATATATVRATATVPATAAASDAVAASVPASSPTSWTEDWGLNGSVWAALGCDLRQSASSLSMASVPPPSVTPPSSLSPTSLTVSVCRLSLGLLPLLAQGTRFEGKVRRGQNWRGSECARPPPVAILVIVFLKATLRGVLSSCLFAACCPFSTQRPVGRGGGSAGAHPRSLSDYVRFVLLAKFGGLYLDADSVSPLHVLHRKLEFGGLFDLLWGRHMQLLHIYNSIPTDI